MEIKVLKSGLLQTNTYIVSMEDKCVIIDPAFAYDSIIEYIDIKNFNVLGIFLTHGHFDHIDASEKLVKKYGCKIYIGKDDVSMLADASLNGSSKYLRRNIIIGEDYLFVIDSEKTLKLCDFVIDVLLTPGHSMGSCCYIINGNLFSGDTLFKNGIGRVDFPGGNAELMEKSLYKVLSLNDDMMVFPGHGEDTTISKEKSRYI